MIQLSSSSSSSDHEDEHVPLISREEPPRVPHEEEVPRAGSGDIPMIPDDLVPEPEDDF